METTAPTQQSDTTGTQVAGRAARPIEVVRSGLEQMRPQFKATLPSHISVDRFERVVMTAINTNPDLLDADKRSLFNACIRSAQDGLLPDGREGALVIFKDKSGKKLVTFMPMVFGLIKKIRQSGEIDSIGARIVYQNEIDGRRFSFIVKEGTEQLFHDPMLWGDRGQKVLVYAYARFKETGHVEYAPLHRDDVMKRRRASRSADTGPWVSWEDEMWKKCAIRAIAKRLPLSSEIMSTIERDEAPTEFDTMKAAAIAQLGAPDPRVDNATQEMEAGGGEPGGWSSALDLITKTVERAAIEMRSPDLKTVADVDEFAIHIKSVIEDAEIDHSDKSRLLGEFNASYLQRVRELGK